VLPHGGGGPSNFSHRLALFVQRDKQPGDFLFLPLAFHDLTHRLGHPFHGELFAGLDAFEGVWDHGLDLSGGVHW